MIDFTNIPEGATHYSEENEYCWTCWWKLDEGKSFFIRADASYSGWSAIDGGLPNHAKPIPTEYLKPVQPEQSESPNAWHERGELPPAGVECEVKHKGEWHKTRIIGISSVGSVVYECGDFDEDYTYDGSSAKKCFRPIRTERERFVDKAAKNYDGGIFINMIREWAGKMYDAGARFPEGDD